MKTLYTLALGVILLTAPSLSRADRVITVTNLNWNGSTFIPDCASPGTNCTMTMTVAGIAVADDGHGNWVVSGRLSNRFVAVSGQNPMVGAVGGYVFPNGSTFQIQQGEFPGVPAMTVNLSGIQTDPQGNWVILIPKQ